jgi:hypothetical protein
MRNKRLALAASSLAVCGLLAVAILSIAEEDPLATIIQQYEGATKKKVNRASGDDLYAVAKWCFQNNRQSEAQAVALEANQKAPDDTRPKYLLYLVTSSGGGPATEVTAADENKGAEATITPEEVTQIYKTEGDPAMNGFRNVELMMINTCGNLKCHGGGNPASKWVIIRRNATDKRTIGENFRTVNKYVTRGESWADSPLLQKPTKGPEAGHPQIVMRTTDQAYVRISAWIKTLKTETQKNIWGDASKATVPATGK